MHQSLKSKETSPPVMQARKVYAESPQQVEDLLTRNSSPRFFTVQLSRGPWGQAVSLVLLLLLSESGTSPGRWPLLPV